MAIKRDPVLPKSLIQDLIRAAENRSGFELDGEDFEFLTFSVISFVNKAIDKFIAGAREHQDNAPFVKEVDHIACMEEEAIDQWNYVLGHQRKMRKYGPRNSKNS